MRTTFLRVLWELFIDRIPRFWLQASNWSEEPLFESKNASINHNSDNTTVSSEARNLYLVQLGSKKLPPGSLGFPLVVNPSVLWKQGHRTRLKSGFRNVSTSLDLCSGPRSLALMWWSWPVRQEIALLSAGVTMESLISSQSQFSEYLERTTISNFQNLGISLIIRGAIVGFLKPESIQKFVFVMDSQVQDSGR